MKDTTSYPAKFTEENGGYSVSFRDLPGAITEGNTFEEALKYAKDALTGHLEAMLENDFEFSPPTEKDADEIEIPVPAYLAFSIIVRAYRKEHGLTQTDFAKVLSVTQQQVALLEKPSKNRRLETVAEVLGKIGFTMEIKKAW